MSSAVLMETRDLHFAYAGGPPVIRGVTLALPAGTLCGIIGANGCGKSTLIRLLAGVLQPGAGEILLDGVPLASVAPREAATRIAYVPQATVAAFPFTALEVVLTGRTPYSRGFGFESPLDREKAMEALATVEGVHLAARPVTELSGGERQMVSLARALAQEPNCLLLDEPAAALDLKHRAALLRTLAHLRDTRGLTAVVVTHDLHLMDPVFDRVVALRRGEVIAEGTPQSTLQENVLAEVYDDTHVRATRVDGRTLIWSE